MSHFRNKKNYFLISFIILALFTSMLAYSHKQTLALTEPIEDLSFQPEFVAFSSEERISTTGWNSTQAELTFNPSNDQVYLSWIDLYKPFTADEESTIYYSSGNRTDLWNSPDFVTSINETLAFGFVPAFDASNSVHIPYEEYVVDNFEINEVIIDNGVTVQPESNIITNTGDSFSPSAITDSNGIVHLVWCDTTDNANGDLYYTNYSSSSGIWKTPIVRITNGADVFEKSPVTITVDENNTIHLVWVDERAADQELYYIYSEDGVTWSSEEKITTVPYEPVLPEMVYDKTKNKLHVVFNDTGTSSNLYYIKADSKALAGGWSTPTSIDSYLAENADYNLFSDIYGNTLLAFERNVTSQIDVYFSQISNSSSSWSTPLLVSELSYDPSITMDSNGYIYIAYTKLYQSATEVYIKTGILDTDQDGLSDADELNIHNTDPNLLDTDGDTVSDGEEVLVYNSDPNDTDSDDDLMPDGWEAEYNFDLINASDATEDNDFDNLTNLEEFNANTHPYFPDSDFDSISDGDEVLIYFTDPTDDDTDGDTLLDNYEIIFGELNGTRINPLIFDNVTEDYDNDGLENGIEATLWTDPLNADTDGDGFTDGDEFYLYETDPNDPDDYPVTQQPADYRKIIIGILTGVGTGAIFLTFTFLVVRQFRPSDSSKRKQLQREEKEYLDKHVSKGKEMKYETDEKVAIDAMLKKRKEIDEDIPKRTIDDIVADAEEAEKLEEPMAPPEPSEDEITDIKAKMRETITALKNYEEQLTKILKKDLTTFNVSTVSRETLTEFAADSQSLYSEAKVIWTNTILPLIKGVEEKLHSDTLEAEQIIDNCSSLSDKILDILVKREMEIVEEETRREEVKQAAMKALEENEQEDVSEEKEDEKEESAD
ncbi:MAG: hypothetical protein FK733_15665 [Asgard group archaeon]|nr:hypothetical protein [Asgard group archaeon]